MAPRFVGLGKGLVIFILLTSLGRQALYGEGPRQILSVLFSVMGVMATAGAVLDHVRPRPKRRRSAENRDTA
ncbi:hypothetical protein OHB54_41250 [Streptomyces sp. NBC_01007]|nr:hypothetical protein OHB54_41250 [Streptomyces sp. NBC_01007]